MEHGSIRRQVAGKLKRVDDATIASMTLEPQLEMNSFHLCGKLLSPR